MANKKGNPAFGQIRNRDTTAANAKRKEKADAFAREILQVLMGFRTRGVRSHGMAKLLNAHGYKTSTGKQWTATAVRRVFRRFGLT